MDRAFQRFDLATREGLRAFLRVQARVVPALEAAAETRDPARLLPDWPQRRRAAALAEDLRALRAAALDAPSAAEPPSDEPLGVATPADDAEAWGLLYVLEVSRLGGAALARRALGAQDEAVRRAVRFLTHGDPGLWSTFVERLNADPAAQDRPDRVAAAALAAFAAFEAALDEAD